MSAQSPPSEKDVVVRINRYSALRSVERAISPSVRSRLPLAHAGRRQGVLLQLQRLLGGSVLHSRVPTEPAVALEGLSEVDAELEALGAHLTRTLRRTPLSQFRATLPDVVHAHRGDAVALLDFWLEQMSPGEDPLHLVDYLITLLSTDEIDGQVTVVTDPATVSAGVARAVQGLQEMSASPDAKRAHEVASKLRESSISVLHAEDLEEMIVDMRALKARAADVYFDRDLLRSAVQYNATVKNRFATLLEIDREQDASVMRTLEALRALDAPNEEPPDES
jgi:hypothetical protein